MSDAKHNPGPWEVTGTDRNDQQTVSSRGRLIAVVCHECLRANLPSMEANARLISAAPDMLDVLESVEWNGLGEFRSCPSCFGWKPNGHKPNCKIAAAIRKAKGGTG